MNDHPRAVQYLPGTSLSHNWKFLPIDQHHPMSHNPQPLAPTTLFCLYHLGFSFSIPHRSEIIQYLSFSVSLISLSINALQVHPCCCKWQNFILFMAEQYSIVHMHHIFIHLSVNGQLGCFHVLAIVNSAAMNIGVHVSFRISFLQIYFQEWDYWIIWQLYF